MTKFLLSNTDRDRIQTVVTESSTVLQSELKLLFCKSYYKIYTMPPKKQFRQANLSPFFQAPTPSDIDASSQKVPRETTNESSSSRGCRSHKYISMIVF